MDRQNDYVVAVKLKNVNKMYKLFKRSTDRLKAQFSDKIPYTKKFAIHDVSLEIGQGESVALLGKNGAGKSTMLKLITGVSYPTSGFIRVNGRVCALLELTTGFDQELSGRGNIYLKAGILGIKREEIAGLEDDIIEFSGLGQYIDQPVQSYSSGMKARLGFAINVNLNPDILIVDEALSVGDSEFRLKCKDKIGELVSQGVTLLFVTHSLDEAKLFCKRGIVLQSGHVVFDAPIQEAAEYYARTIRPVRSVRKQVAKGDSKEVPSQRSSRQRRQRDQDEQKGQDREE